MKPLCAFLVVWMALGTVAFAERRGLGEGLEKQNLDPSPEYMAIFEEGRKLYYEKKYDAAEQRLQIVAGRYPHHQATVKLLTAIRLERQNDPAVAIRRKLDSIVLPRVNFRDAVMGNALDFVREELRRLDREGKGVNIVVNLSDEIKQRKITLDLIDVTASEVLKYMAEVGGFEVRVDRSIVYVASKEPATPRPGTPATQSVAPELPPIPGAN